MVRHQYLGNKQSRQRVLEPFRCVKSCSMANLSRATKEGTSSGTGQQFSNTPKQQRAEYKCVQMCTNVYKYVRTSTNVGKCGKMCTNVGKASTAAGKQSLIQAIRNSRSNWMQSTVHKVTKQDTPNQIHQAASMRLAMKKLWKHGCAMKQWSTSTQHRTTPKEVTNSITKPTDKCIDQSVSQPISQSMSQTARELITS